MSPSQEDFARAKSPQNIWMQRIADLEKRVASLEAALVEVIEKAWPGQTNIRFGP